MSSSITDRVEKANHVSPENLISMPPVPKSAKIEITSRCNYKCSYCAVSKSGRKKGDMDFDMFRRIVSELADLGVEEVGLFLLGESFLVKDLPNYVKYCKYAGIPYVFITTNGSLCTKEAMTPVIEAGLDSVKFSINAGTRERYREMTGRDMFNDVIRNIKWLKEYKVSSGKSLPSVAVSSIFKEEYKDELAALKESLKDFIDDYYLMPPYNQGGQIQGFSGSVVGNPGKLDTMVPPVPCWVLFNAIKITWDGKMTACPFDHESAFEIADLKTTSIADAWNDFKFVALRRDHLENNIRNKACLACLGMN